MRIASQRGSIECTKQTRGSNPYGSKHTHRKTFRREMKMFRVAGLLLGTFSWLTFVIYEFVYITDMSSEVESQDYVRYNSKWNFDHD